MQNKIIRALLISTGLLIVPIMASFFVEGWLWDVTDYIFAWVLFSFVSLAFTFVASSAKSTAYKVAAGLAVVATFLLVWVNGAVGIIGDSDINMLYAFVVFTLFIGAILTRLKPRGMSLTLYTAAFVQFMIPVIALLIGEPDFRPGIMQTFILNSAWVMVFIGSGILFRQASDTNSK